MKALLLCSLAALGFATDNLADQISTVDDEWEEEVVIRRKKTVKKPAVQSPAVTTATTNLTAAPVVAETSAKPTEPPPPPEPPDADAAEPRRLVRYFCKAWKDRDYTRMYWAMTPEYRKQVKFKKFRKLFDEDRESNGGIVDENIVLDDTALDDGNIQVHVDLIYKFKRVGVRRVKAVAEKRGSIYRLRESSIIPLDMDDL